jgi:hypothetical protein
MTSTNSAATTENGSTEPSPASVENVIDAATEVHPQAPVSSETGLESRTLVRSSSTDPEEILVRWTSPSRETGYPCVL